MPNLVTARSTFTQATTEQRLIRFVDDGMLMLEPNEQALITFLLKLKSGAKKKTATSPRIEWFERDHCARWAQADAAGYTSGVTTMTLVDGTLVVPGDVLLVPKAVTSSLAPELILVTGVSGNVITSMVRGFAGTTPAAIAANAGLAILGEAFAEGSALANPKSSTAVPKISYTEIFKKTVTLTRTAIASGVYAGPNGDRALEHEILMKEMKISMNRSFLWGKASEDMSVPAAPLRTTMGINSVIATNIFDAGGTVTPNTLESWARTAFRYGAKTKLLLAPPLLKSAVNRWASAMQHVPTNETVLGVDIQRIQTGHGVWLLASDWMLEDGVTGQPGFGGTGYSLDLDAMSLYDLSGHGESRSLRLIENAVQDGSDKVVDSAECECGLVVKHERYHAKIFNITGYSS